MGIYTVVVVMTEVYLEHASTKRS